MSKVKCDTVYQSAVVPDLKKHVITPDRRQSRTISHFQKNRYRLPNKAFSIAKTAIDELKLDVFDCHYIDFGNRKR